MDIKEMQEKLMEQINKGFDAMSKCTTLQDVNDLCNRMVGVIGICQILELIDEEKARYLISEVVDLEYEKEKELYEREERG